MFYARIDNGKVVEIIETLGHNIEDMFTPNLVATMVEAGEGMVVNGTYDGSVFGPEPEPTPPTQESINLTSRRYLTSTGWYVERLNDPSSGKAIPQDILDARAAARLAII